MNGLSEKMSELNNETIKENQKIIEMHFYELNEKKEKLKATVKELKKSEDLKAEVEELKARVKDLKVENENFRTTSFKDLEKLGKIHDQAIAKWKKETSELAEYFEMSMSFYKTEYKKLKAENAELKKEKTTICFF